MQPSASTAPRRGRPPASAAGVAETRVLDAATSLFLEQGYGRTTIDQVAVQAGTGKSSIYSRFGDKPALFGAVVRRSIDMMFAETERASDSLTGEARLNQVGVALARNLLVPRCVALMRIVAAEAETMPQLAEDAYQISYEGSIARVDEALAGATFPADFDRTIAARRFLELAVQPLSFQAAFGAPLEWLCARVEGDVADAIVLLSARGVRFDRADD